MHVDVSDILMEGEGAQADYKVEGETPELEGIKLAAPISGEIRVIGTKEGVVAAGKLQTDVELECNRCLRAFNHSLEFPLEAEFSDHPREDEFLIDKHGKIVLDEPIRQEIEIRLPLQQLCEADCSGIELKQKKE